MTRTASILAISFVITAVVVASIGWFTQFAGPALMAHIRQDPDGPFWLRLLTPVLPGFFLLIFGLVTAARRRKAAKAGSDIVTPAGRIGA